jgi:hypothetical protein
MSFFKRIAGIAGILSALVARNAYAETQPLADVEPTVVSTSTYFQPTLDRQIVPVRDRINLSDYGSMSEEQRKEISDFVKDRYEARLSNGFREANKYDLIRDLAKSIEVPIGNGHKYLSGNVIRFILD